MANKGIKGITIEIGGDTKGLNKALEGVNKQSKDLQSELKEVERGLKLDPGNVELIRQKQELLTASIASTSDKLDVLRTAQSQVQAQFDRGDIGVEQYRAFQRELQQTEGEMNRLQSQLGSLGAEQDRLSQTTRQLGTFFEATGTDVEQFSGTLGTRLTQAIRDGSASADQMERALRLMGRQALGAGADIDQLREALRNADNGANLDEIRQDLARITEEANTAEDAVNGFGQELSGVIGGLSAGGGIAGVVSKALDTSSLDTKIDIAFNIPEESKQSILEAIKSVDKYGVEGEEALEGVRRQWALNKLETDQANASIVEGAAVITKTYAGIDFIELIQETNEFAAALEISNEEALAMTNSLLKFGFPPEQLDILAEYGLQMKEVGFSTAEIQGIFEKGVDLKSWNVDNLNDGVKEANLKMKEYGREVPKALAAVLKGTTVSTEQMQNWGKAVASGGKEGATAMSEVSDWLQTIEDDALRNEMAIAVFGTKAEDQGDNMIKIFQGLADAQDKTIQNQNEMNETTERYNTDPIVRMNEAINNMMIALKPILMEIAGIVAMLAQWASENPTLIASLVAIGTTLGILVGAFALLMPAIGGLVTAWPLLVAGFGAIGAPILVAVAAIAGLATAFVALWQNSETFRTNLTSVFEAIKNVAVTVFETVASFIGEKISQIKAFWDAEGTQILQAAENIFNGIMAVIQFVMPAIKLIIDVVWSAIKQVISGALNVIMGAVKIFSGLFTGDISKMWEGVKQLFFGAINVIIGWISLTFVGGIRSLLANLGKTALSLVKGMWDNVFGVFKTMGGSIRSFTDDTLSKVIGFFRNFVTNVKTQMNNAKQGVIDIWGKAVAFLKNIDLKQIGKNIVQGLINGIGSMGSFVTEKVRDMANSILNTFKKVLDIHSPAKSTDKIGQQTGEGFANGIAKKKAAAVKAAKAVADSAKKNFESKMKDLSLKFKAEKINTTDYIKSLETLKKEYKKVPLAISKVDAEIATLRKKNSKELFEVDKKALDDKIKYGNLTMDQEVKLLQKMVGQYKKNSEERIYFEDKVKDKLLQVTQEKQKINENYLSNVQTLNQKHIDEENRLNAEYQKVLDDRTKSLYSFAGIFDEFVSKDISGDTLLMNLYSQVSAFQDWQKNITALAKKGINEGLLAELQEMGPKAGAEIAALNTLTDVQLNQYVNLWKEKNALAKGQALNELKDLKAQTATQITELRKETAAQLLVYQDEWKKAMVDTRGKVKDEMKQMPAIGQFAVSGLINGLSAKRKELITVAQQLANDVKGAFQGALDIHSPSRVFHGFGVNINEGLIKGIQDSTSRLNSAMDNVYGSLASSASKSNANQIANQQIINQSSNIDLTSLVGAIISLANRPVETSIFMNDRVLANAVSKHQYNDSSLAAMLKGTIL